LLTLPAQAGTEAASLSGNLRVEVIASYNLIVDSNGQQAPSAAYIGAKIHNDGTTDLTDVFAYIGDHTLVTPGIYPSRTNPDGVFTGTLSLTHEGGSAGTADATRYLGTIPAGEYVTVYWLVSYPQRDDADKLLWGDSVKPDDDLWLEYDVWATGNDGAAQEANVNRRFYFRNEISASANKIEPNTANKVPTEYQELFNEYQPTWSEVAQNGSPGTSIVARGVWYDLGTVGEGFDNDGDLVPDHNAWMQPVGDASTFDPSAYRLVKTTAMLIVKLKGGGITVIQADDELYFEHIPENTGVVGWVGYEYLVRKDAGLFDISPYQEVASGKDNEKFNADFGAGPVALDIPDLEATIDKSTTATTIAPDSNVPYTITVANTGTQDLGHPELNMPLIISDTIPTGTQYVGSSATVVSLPAGVTAEILYSTDSGASWTATEPGTPSAVTDIQWWLSDPLSAGQSAEVGLSVYVPLASTLAVLTNTAGLLFGPGDPTLEDDATTVVTGSFAISGTVFNDDGAGALYADGVKDPVSESGIASVDVLLYYDADSDGVVDDGDILVDSTTSAGDGTYSFASLANGSYLVVVDTADAPAGTTLTTDETLPVTLSGANSTGNDFGFAPALSLTKQTVGGVTTFTEGDTVQYTIDVGNMLPGDGTGLGSATNDIYASTYTPLADTGDAWLTPTEALGAPDGAFATADLGGNDVVTGVSGFALAGSGTILSVDLVLKLTQEVPTTGDDTVTIEVRDTSTGNTVYQVVKTNTDIQSLAGSDLVLPVNTIERDGVGVGTPTGWQWSDFQVGNPWQVALIVHKNANDDGANLQLDSVAFQVTGDQAAGGPTAGEKLQPVPLTDTYDPAQLEFVSADPTPTSVAAGTLTWDDIGPIYPGGTKQVTVTFKALEPANNTQSTTTDNDAEVAGAYFQDGSPANDANDTATITVNPAGSIGDRVWWDVNQDGLQTGEGGIPGVTVTLYNDLGTIGTYEPGTDTLVGTAVTGSTGDYVFDGLSGTDYVVIVDTATLPGGSGTNTHDLDGNNDSETFVTIDPTATDGSDTVSDADFGYYFATAPPAISGYVWEDVDRGHEATQEAGDVVRVGVTVTLYSDTNGDGVLDGGDTPVTSTTTDGTGYYSFAGPYTGDYLVVVDDTTGDMNGTSWNPSYDSDGLATTSTVALTGLAGDIATADFSYYQSGPHSIGDTLFYDWNANGTQDSPSDAGIANITVSLYEDLGALGTYEPGVDFLLGTTTTAADGTYQFAGLYTDDYIVIVDEDDPDFPSGYNQSADPDDTGQGGTTNDGQGAIHVTASRTDVDFGYTPVGFGSIGDTVFNDVDGDGSQSAFETGIGDITVTLYADLNGGGYVEIATTTTDSNGNYLFDNLPDGDYQVVVDTTDTDLPTDVFGTAYYPTTATTVSSILVSGGDDHLDTDFGFAAKASIGDTVYWDTNENGTQDPSEPGIENVTVTLYEDSNGDGVHDGSDADQTGTTATTDITGYYVFTDLDAGDYVVVVDTSAGSPVETVPQTADPDNDGLVCGDPDANEPCDNATGMTVALGQNYIGADFGYQPLSAIGDTVWIDLNGNGTLDDGEQGIPYITMTLDPPASVNLGAGDGNPVTTDTDADGYYSFANLPDGTYTLTIDSATIAALPGSPSESYEVDGSNDSSVTFTVTGGVVDTITGVGAVTDADFTLDFGYAYTGTNSLSGTVGLDGASLNGVMGSGTSGVDTDESAFANQTVYLYLFDDVNSDGIYDSATETATLITSAITDSNGDYSFTNLPDGTGTEVYLVSLAAPLGHLALTTTDPVTPATNIVKTENLAGDTTSAYQVVAIASPIEGVDFAFELTLDYDFGDLPQTYSTKIGDTPDPAYHVVPGTLDLYLGSTVDSEPNGQPTADATGDGADEDGITVGSYWQDGTGTGSISYTVGLGSGWLVAWVDFDQSGDFTGTGEMIISQAVSAGGPTEVTFDIPANTINVGAPTTLNARFRLFPSEPGIPEVAYSGEASDGEVEDYQWSFGSIGDLVWDDTNGDGIKDAGESGFANVTVALYEDVNGNGVYDSGTDILLDTVTTDASGAYDFSGVAAGDYLVTVTDTNNVLTGYALTGGTTDPTAVTLTAGEVNDTVDFGYAFGTVDGRVYIDNNADGLYDPGIDTPLPGVGVTVTDANSTVYNLTTDPYGYFTTPAAVGAATVDVNDADLPDDGVPPSPDWALTTGSTDSTAVTVPAGGTATDDTGYVLTAGTGLVQGTLYTDVNGNGYYDSGDTPLSGVDVDITDSAAGTYTVTTDANGYFQQVVPAGSTTVDVDETTLPAGATLTTDIHGEGNDPTVVTVPDGGAATDNTGYLSSTTGLVEGTIYRDDNADGQYILADDFELAGVTVVITDANGGVYTVTTDSNGYFSQTVAAGDATVDVVDADIPAGYTLTDDSLHGEGSDPTVVTVPAGLTATDNTGYVSPANTGTIEGTVYVDNNDDGGGYDSGVDTPLPYVTVKITDATGGIYYVTTDENGYFSQTVAAGDATVEVDPDGTDLPAALDPNSISSNPTFPVTVPPNGTGTNDTGYVVNLASTGLVQGTLYIDENGDGLLDSGDTPIPNVDVLITKSDTTTVTVTTDENGYFQALVPLGSTTVDIDQTDPDVPGGLSLTTDAHNQGTDPTTVTVPDGGAATDNTGTVYLATPAFGVKASCSAPATGGVLVQWSVQVELGVLKYLVQVSEGAGWTTLGNVFARTEGLSGANYEYLDRQAPVGVARAYRLVCVDVDGKSRTHAAGQAAATAQAALRATVRQTIPDFPADGVSSVEELSYDVQHYATDTPAMLGTARKATVAAGGLYRTGDASLVYNLGARLPDLGGMVYIRPYSDPYTDANVVWSSDGALAIAGEPGIAPAPAAQGILGSDGYTAVVHVEKDESLALNSMFPPGPNWYYGYTDRLAPGNAPILLANVPSPASAGTASIRVALRSTTDGDHDLGVTVNEIPVARATWSGKGYHMVRVEFDLATCRLKDGENRIQLWTTVADSSKRLDYLEVLTPATPVLRDGGLVVDVLAGATGFLSVPGLAHAVDITDFANESLLGLQRGSLSGLHAGQKLYLTDHVDDLDWSAAKDLTALDDALAGQQYVAVAPAAWLDVLAPLVAKHEAEGLASVAVSWEDVCDTYGGGLPTPAGLVRLGQRVQPQYLLLAAGASHDPKGLEGDLPPAGIATGFVHVHEGTASTDDLYTNDFATAVGRLPARSRDELTNMVNKIVDFYPGRRAVMMADVDDETMSFDSFLQFQADLAEDLPSVLLDANTMDGAAMRSALIAAINDGANLVTYQGHGNNALIGDDFDILNTSHASQVPPSAWLLATCLTGVYTLETDTTRVLSSSLLRTPGNGAVSVLASTCFGDAGIEHLIAETAAREIAAGGATWGGILLRVKQTLLPDETAAIYTLLGDPAMRTLNPVAGDREIIIREPVAGGFINGDQAPVIRFGLRGDWWRQQLEILWRKDYGQWQPLKEITIDPETFDYTIPWDPPPEDGKNYQIMVREIGEESEGR
jgi:phosphatidate phosphatase APP1